MLSKPINMGRGFLDPTPKRFYTVPEGMITILQEAVFSTHGSESDFSMWIVPAGQALADEYKVQDRISIYAREARYLTLATVLSAGDQVYFSSDQGGVTFIASGLEVSAGDEAKPSQPEPVLPPIEAPPAETTPPKDPADPPAEEGN